jgi:hypothetical protein
MSLCDIIDLGIFLILFVFGNRDFHGGISSNFEEIIEVRNIIFNIVILIRKRSKWYTFSNLSVSQAFELVLNVFLQVKRVVF